MRTMNLYYVYDNVNEIAITPFIPQANDLAAALGFRDAYIKNDENVKKSTVSYQVLDLVRFGQIDVTEDGEFVINENNIHFNEIVRIQGKEIMEFIKNKMIELGIDDNLLEEL